MARLDDIEAGNNDHSAIEATYSFKRTIGAILLITITLIFAAGYSYFSFDRLTKRTLHRTDALSAVLLETSQAHLWFEEILWGDTNESIEIVWTHFDDALEYANHLMSGGNITTGPVAGLSGTEFQGQMQEIIDLLNEFDALAHTRLDAAEVSRSGTSIDQQFDDVFNRLTSKTVFLGAALRQESRRQMGTAKMMNLALVLLYIALAVALLMVLHRYEKNQKLSAELLSKRDSQLRQAQKMEAVGNLAGGIAHDFNNLLQAILGYGEVLSEDLAAEGRSTEEVGHILTAGRRASELTRQLLAYSRRQIIAPADLDLNALIANLVKMLQRLIGENITLETAVSDDILTINADRAQMEQILMNLCINARDAIGNDEAGTVAIETTNVVIDDAYCADHVWARPGPYALLIITDTGCGMSQEVMDEVFEPFFTTKSVGKGTGLGLSTVYGVVKQNGGMVNAYSELEHGSTFKVYWPLIDGLPEAEVKAEVATSLRGSGTILVAEDDAGVRKFVIRLLQDSGYRVLATEDGQQAIEVFDTDCEDIDLALLDVVMPNKSGREVMEHIRQSGSNIPVIFCSGYSLNAIHTDFVLDEGVELVEKPYRRHDLLVKIRNALKPAE